MTSTEIPTVTMTCPYCGYVGRCVVPIPVDNIWCSQCHGRIEPPADFRKRDASFDEIVRMWELQERVLPKRMRPTP